MEFTTLEQIKNHFGIKEISLDEIRKELITLLAENHPDKTGGIFSSPYRKTKYEEIDSAIKFLETIKQDIVISNHDLSVLVKTIQDLVPQTTVAQIKNTSEEVINRLDTKISSSIVHFQKRHLFPKVSSLAISGALTILWTFPQIAQEHLILKRYISSENSIFSVLWFSSLIITVLTWLHIKRNERRDELIKKSYNLESTQNMMFKLFLAWTQTTNHSQVDSNSHRRIIKFTKDELVNFILNKYEIVKAEFHEYIDLDAFQLYFKMSDDANKDRIKFLKHSRRDNNTLSIILNFAGRPGEIDIDLAQNLSETIITRLSNRKIIELSKKQSFSDTYEYIDLK
jgi:hypothetical protein